MKEDYEALAEYAVTQRQGEILLAVIKHGSQSKAAKELGITRTNVEKALKRIRTRAATKGHAPEQDWTHPAPPGYMLRGQSILYDGDGNVKQQWVKTKEDSLAQFEAMAEAVKDLFKNVPKAKPRKAPLRLDKNSFTLYPEGDPHWGMRVWGPEVDGDNYDLSIAFEQYLTATDILVEAAPKTELAVLLNVGDNFHSDIPENKTRKSGNHLNVDGRQAKVFRKVIEARRYRIDKMLAKHSRVIVREVYGNHDEILTMGFTEALKGYYHDEPRVIIADSPSAFWHFAFGKVLIGATHGDKATIKDMPLLMATDVPAMWGVTEHRHIYTGHQHHMERWETAGCVVEMLRTLAGRNEFEHAHGYRAKRDMMFRVFHRDYGEVQTYRITPARLEKEKR